MNIDSEFPRRMKGICGMSLGMAFQILKLSRREDEKENPKATMFPSTLRFSDVKPWERG